MHTGNSCFPYYSLLRTILFSITILGDMTGSSLISNKVLLLEFIVLITSLCAAPMSILHYPSKTAPAVILAKEPLKAGDSLACLMIIVESLTPPAVVAGLAAIVPMLL